MIRILAALLLLAAPAGAKELRVLTGAGMAVPVRALAADFGAKADVQVSVVSDTAGGVQKRVEAGEKYDLVIATTTVLGALSDKHFLAPHHHALAQMVAGLAVKAGAPMPDLPDAKAFGDLLRAAKSIAYVDPAQGGITGVFFLAQADKLGVGDMVRAKAVAAGKAQYGVTLISEMLPNKGVRVTALPDAVQMTTIYAAAIAADAQNGLDAARLLDTLTGQDGALAARNAGLKPVSH